MKMVDIQRRVNEIEAVKNDPEQAHGMEDVLHQQVLRAISLGQCEAPMACAGVALKTLAIPFPRHCA